MAQKAPSEKCKENTINRFIKLRDCKFSYFKKKYGNEPYRESLKDFYEETGCGWLGKNIDMSMSVKPMNESINENNSKNVVSSKKESNTTRAIVEVLSDDDEWEDDGMPDWLA